MGVSSYIRGLRGKLLLLATGLLAGCNSLIYDQEGDCTYRVKFRYDRNMKFADAFAHEVESVTLYLLDPATGEIVWQRTEQGEALHREDYAMTVEVAPGTYDLLAWCGDREKGSFTVDPSAMRREELGCTLRRTDEEGRATVRGDLDRLYHGYLPACAFDDTGAYTYVVPLTKDTNNVRVVLQQLSGEPIDAQRFAFTITACNGSMEWNNDLRPDDRLTYPAWHVREASAGMEGQPSEGIGKVNAVVAELTTARLMERDKTPDRRAPGAEFTDADRMRLHIADTRTGKTVVDMPLVDYALLVKGEHRKEMSDQEFLDRMDEYNLIFVLDEGFRWVSMSIDIHSWKLVFQNTGI